MISDVLHDAVVEMDRYLYSPEWRHHYTGQTRDELKALRTMMDGVMQRLDMLKPATLRPASEVDINDEDLLEFYQYRMFKKLIDMTSLERAAYMSDIFGRRWLEVYEKITHIYPALNDSKTDTPSTAPALGDELCAWVPVDERFPRHNATGLVWRSGFFDCLPPAPVASVQITRDGRTWIRT